MPVREIYGLSAERETEGEKERGDGQREGERCSSAVKTRELEAGIKAASL